MLNVNEDRLSIKSSIIEYFHTFLFWGHRDWNQQNELYLGGNPKNVSYMCQPSWAIVKEVQVIMYIEKCVIVQYCIYQQTYLQCCISVTWNCLTVAPGCWRGFFLKKVLFVGFNLCDLLYEQSGLCGITVWKALYVLNDLNIIVHMCWPLICHTLTCSVSCHPTVKHKENKSFLC
jgi:hypothetical protein